VLLDDPRKVLRAGTSVLMTWDLAFDDKVDGRGVETYVREAVSRYEEYEANSKEILERSRNRSRTERESALGAQGQRRICRWWVVSSLVERIMNRLQPGLSLVAVVLGRAKVDR
jgi:hypothetical protein